MHLLVFWAKSEVFKFFEHKPCVEARTADGSLSYAGMGYAEPA